MNLLKILVLTCFLAATARADLLGHHARAERFSVSGDGTTVGSVSRSEMRFWDVSKRVLHSTLSLANSDHNGVLALSGDGRRLLRRQKKLTGMGESSGFRWVLWRQVGPRWQAGSIVAHATLTGKWPLAIRFVGQELLVLWPEHVEQFGPTGKLQTRVTFEATPIKLIYNAKNGPGWAVGDISPNGKLVILSQGKFAALFSATSGRQKQRLEIEHDYGIHDWYFAPSARFVLGRNSYQLDGDERSPMESDEWIWDTQTGKMLCHLQDVNTRAPHFWSPTANTLLEALGSHSTSSQTQTFQARDACDHERIFTFPRSWPSQRSISQFRFLDEGKILIALDRAGDIWVETLRRNEAKSD